MMSKHAFRSLKSHVARFLRDESGAELIESVLVIGLIVVVSLTAMSAFGETLARKWNVVVESL